MKKTLVAIAIAAVTLGTVVVAGHASQGFGCNKDPQHEWDHEDVERFVERKVRRLSESLDLSEMQQTAIAEVMTEERVNRLEQRQAACDRISGLLTEGQLATFETMREPGHRGHHRFKGHHRGGNIEHRIDRMTSHLGLDEVQQEQIREIFEQKQSIKQNQRDETLEQLSAVLTDEQKAKLDKLRGRFSQKQL